MVQKDLPNSLNSMERKEAALRRFFPSKDPRLFSSASPARRLAARFAWWSLGRLCGGSLATWHELMEHYTLVANLPGFSDTIAAAVRVPENAALLAEWQRRSITEHSPPVTSEQCGFPFFSTWADTSWSNAHVRDFSRPELQNGYLLFLADRPTDKIPPELKPFLDILPGVARVALTEGLPLRWGLDSYFLALKMPNIPSSLKSIDFQWSSKWVAPWEDLSDFDRFKPVFQAWDNAGFVDDYEELLFTSDYRQHLFHGLGNYQFPYLNVLWPQSEAQELELINRSLEFLATFYPVEFGRRSETPPFQVSMRQWLNAMIVPNMHLEFPAFGVSGTVMLKPALPVVYNYFVAMLWPSLYSSTPVDPRSPSLPQPADLHFVDYPVQESFTAVDGLEVARDLTWETGYYPVSPYVWHGLLRFFVSQIFIEFLAHNIKSQEELETLTAEELHAALATISLRTGCEDVIRLLIRLLQRSLATNPTHFDPRLTPRQPYVGSRRVRVLLPNGGFATVPLPANYEYI